MLLGLLTNNFTNASVVTSLFLLVPCCLLIVQHNSTSNTNRYFSLTQHHTHLSQPIKHISPKT